MGLFTKRKRELAEVVENENVINSSAPNILRLDWPYLAWPNSNEDAELVLFAQFRQFYLLYANKMSDEEKDKLLKFTLLNSFEMGLNTVGISISAEGTIKSLLEIWGVSGYGDLEEGNLISLKCRIKCLEEDPNFVPYQIAYAVQFARVYSKVQYVLNRVKEFEQFLKAVNNIKFLDETYNFFSVACFAPPSMPDVLYSSNRPWHVISNFFMALTSDYLKVYRYDLAKEIFHKRAERGLVTDAYDIEEIYRRQNSPKSYIPELKELQEKYNELGFSDERLKTAIKVIVGLEDNYKFKARLKKRDFYPEENLVMFKRKPVQKIA